MQFAETRWCLWCRVNTWTLADNHVPDFVLLPSLQVYAFDSAWRKAWRRAASKRGQQGPGFSEPYKRCTGIMHAWYTLNLVDDDSQCCDQTRDREFMEDEAYPTEHIRLTPPRRVQSTTQITELINVLYLLPADWNTGSVREDFTEALYFGFLPGYIESHRPWGRGELIKAFCQSALVGCRESNIISIIKICKVVPSYHDTIGFYVLHDPVDRSAEERRGQDAGLVGHPMGC